MASNRGLRLSKIVWGMVAAELERRLHSPFVTVSQVIVTPDGRWGTVWLSFSGPDDPKELLAAVEAAKSDVQAYVAANLKGKYVPHLEFKADTGGQQADRVAELLAQIDKKPPHLDA